MPATRSNANPPLQPPFSHHRRNQSASGLVETSSPLRNNISVQEHITPTVPQNFQFIEDPLSSPGHPSPIPDTTDIRPTRSRLSPDLHVNDTNPHSQLLSAIRDQMTFMSDQQRLFQEERTSNRTALRE